MQTKSRQRLVGFLILLAILAIFLPLLFHNTHPSTQVPLSVKIPPKPKMDVRSTIQTKEQLDLTPQATVPNTVPQAETKSEQGQQQPAVSRIQTEPKQNQLAPSAQQPQSKPERITPKPSAQPKPTSVPVPHHTKAVATSAEQVRKNVNGLVTEPKAWAVQLGTFRNIENAKRLIKKLRKKGFDAYTRPVRDEKGNHLLRVYVGPEIHRESAIQLKDKLSASFRLKGVITKYRVRT